MSARLIKVGPERLSLSFAAFAIPSHDVGSSPAGSIDMSPIPVTIYSDEPDAEAQKIIADARTRAAEIERQAAANGRASIQAELEAEVARTVEPWRQQLASTLEEISGLRAAIAEQAERDLVCLAMEIARKIVHREVSIDKEIVVTLARLGLSRVHNRTPAIIHLHPDDFAYVNDNRERIEHGHAFELIEDRSISRGGCLIHTEMGDIDARLDQQFAEIERAFLEV